MNYGTRFNKYFPTRESLKRPKKLGFWGFCAVAAGTSAAVKIVKHLTKDKKANGPVDISGESLAESYEKDKSINYILMKEKKFTKIISNRRKIMELMDLYGAATEAEILEVCGYSREEGTENKVFDSTTKFNIVYEDGWYVMKSQSPREVFEEAEAPDEIKIEEEEDDE